MRCKSQGELYRFGGGTGVATTQVDIALTLGGEEVVETVDVLSGGLPLLLGREFGSARHLWCGICEGEVWQRAGADFRLVGRNQSKGLMLLSLIGEVEAADFPLCEQALAGTVREEAPTPRAEACEADRSVEARPGPEEGDATEAGWKVWPRRKSVRKAKGVQQAERAAAAMATPSGGRTTQPEAAEDESSVVESLNGQESEVNQESEGVEEGAAAEAAPKGGNRIAEAAEELTGEEPEPRTEPLKSQVRDAGTLPKRLRLTDAQLRKLHAKGHRPPARMFKFLCGTLSKQDREKHKAALEELRARCEKVRDECEGCNRMVPKESSGTRMPRDEVEYLGRVWLDVMTLDRAAGVYALGILDEHTHDIALPVMLGHGTEEVIEAYEDRWSSLRGASHATLSDRGRELLAESTVELLNKEATTADQTPAYDSDAHGRIERVFATVRWALDRIVVAEGAPRSLKEWRKVMRGIENDHRNVITVGGYSSAQRATGRGCCDVVQLGDHSPATLGAAHSKEVRRLLELKELARGEYMKARNSRALAQMLAERVRPDVRPYAIGEAVYFRRPKDATGTTRKSQWCGPGVVSAVVQALTSDTQHYKVNHGGQLIDVSRRDIRGVRERAPGENRPLVLPQQLPEERQEAEAGGAKVRPLDGDHAAVVKAVQAAVDSEKRRGPGRPPGSKNRAASTPAEARARRKAEDPAESKAAVKPDSRWAPRTFGQYERTDVTADELQQAGKAGATEIGPSPGEQSKSGTTTQSSLEPLCDHPAEVKQSTPLRDPIPTEVDPASVAGNFGSRDIRCHASVPEADDAEAPVALAANVGGAQMCDIASVDGSDEGQDCGLGFDRCVRTLLAFATQKMDTGATTDTQLEDQNQYEFTWDDVAPEEQEAARMQGLKDYDENGCWETDPSEALTKAELLAFDPDADILGAHWVDKSKLMERDGAIVLAGRSRWTPHGYDEQDPGSVESPTPTQATLRMVHCRGMRKRRVKISFDLGSAFFHSKKKEQSRTWIKEPPELRQADGKVRYRKLYVDVPGTKRGPRSFYETLMDHMIEGGCVRSKVDRCLLYLHDAHGTELGELCVHVDDGMGYVEESAVSWLEAHLSERFMVKFKVVGWHEPHEFTGYECIESEDGCEINQHKYIKAKIFAVPISKQRAKATNSLITEIERSQMRAALGSLRWVHRTSLEIGYELHRASQWVTNENCTVERLNRLNKVIKYLKMGRKEHDAPRDFSPILPSLFIPRLSDDVGMKVVLVADAGDPPNDELYRGKWQGCYVVGIAEDVAPPMIYEHCTHRRDEAKFAPIIWKMSSTRRVAGNSFDGESAIFIEGLDCALSVANECEESEFGLRPGLWERHVLRMDEEATYPVIAIEGHTDSNDLVTASRSLTYPRGFEKRRKSDIADIQQLQALGRMRDVVKIRGVTNPTNAGTKKLSFEDPTMARLRNMQCGFYTPDF